MKENNRVLVKNQKASDSTEFIKEKEATRAAKKLSQFVIENCENRNLRNMHRAEIEGEKPFISLFTNEVIEGFCQILKIDTKANGDLLKERLSTCAAAYNFCIKSGIIYQRESEKIKKEYKSRSRYIREINNTLDKPDASVYALSYLFFRNDFPVENPHALLQEMGKTLENFINYVAESSIPKAKTGPKQQHYGMLVKELIDIAQELSNRPIRLIVNRITGDEEGTLFNFLKAVIPLIDPKFPVSSSGLGRRIKIALKN